MKNHLFEIFLGAVLTLGIACAAFVMLFPSPFDVS